METIWFGLLAFTVTMFVVLDGFDLGAGFLSLFIAKTDAERRQILRSIGPVWDGNEVWLIAAGGTMFLAFPKLLGTALSGFYLPLMIVLWLIVFRGLGIELRHQLEDRMWASIWDASFWFSSTLLAVFFGAALGNVVRGVSFTEDGQFFAPLWTNFGVTGPVGVLDWFTILVGVSALVVLTLHGALWLVWRTDEAVQARAELVAKWLVPIVAVLDIVVGGAAFAIQPRLAESLTTRPAGFVFPLLAVSLLVIPWLMKRGQHAHAFFASIAHIFGLLGATAVGLYPWVLPGRDLDSGLTTTSASTGAYALEVGLYWWLPGICIVLGSHWYVYSRMPRTFSVHDDEAH